MAKTNAAMVVSPIEKKIDDHAKTSEHEDSRSSGTRVETKGNTFIWGDHITEKKPEGDFRPGNSTWSGGFGIRFGR